MASGSFHVHLVTQARDGGVLQHAWALGEQMREAGVEVTAHVPSSHEALPAAEFRVCECIDWAAPLGIQRLRKPGVAVRFAVRTWLHLLGQSSAGDVVHIEGCGWLPLLLWLEAGLRTRGRRVVVSPHNTFNRRATGRWNVAVSGVMMKEYLRRADAVVLFNRNDFDAAAGLNRNVVVSPLVQLVPAVATVAVEAVRESWKLSPGELAVVVPGQIRRDKNLTWLARAAALWPREWRLVIVGEDKGVWSEVQAVSDEVGVRVVADLGYMALPEFAAAVAAADVILCPYQVASQSGVLELARGLGVPAVASRVGGLAEQTPYTYRPEDADGLVSALRSARGGGAGGADAYELQRRLAVEQHLKAYALAAGWRTVAPSCRSENEGNAAE